MELYNHYKFGIQLQDQYWHVYTYFWITAIKSCHVYLGVRSEGGLGACVILVLLNLNRGRCHSYVKFKRRNVEVNLDLVVEQVNQKLVGVGLGTWYWKPMEITHGIRVVGTYKEVVHTPL